MFTGCTSLIGGANTRYNSAYTDKRYARIDTPPEQPGYFTYKLASDSVIVDRIPDMTRYENQFWRLNRDLSRFTSLSIDGITLRQGIDYRASAGSTILSVFARTFARFGEGTHTISAQFGSNDTISQQYTVNLADGYRITSSGMGIGTKYVPYAGKIQAVDSAGNSVPDVRYEIISETNEDSTVPGLGLSLYSDGPLRGYFQGTPQNVGNYTFTVAAILNGSYLASIQVIIQVQDNTGDNVDQADNVDKAKEQGYYFEEIPDIPESEKNQQLSTVLSMCLPFLAEL